MKCQHCEKPATFHITELTDVEVQEVHLCEDHARAYLSESKPAESSGNQSLAGALAHQLQLGQTAEELARLDQQSCPVCGITFYEFRNQGRLGCPHDYTSFEQELEPLIFNIHGSSEHTGKRPRRHSRDSEQQTDLIRMRREMKEAIEMEDYEKASQLRDDIKRIEEGNKIEEGSNIEEDIKIEEGNNIEEDNDIDIDSGESALEASDDSYQEEDDEEEGDKE